MIKPTTRTIFLAAAILFSSASQATTWNVTGVEDGLDGTFGFSSLHDVADPNHPMSGTPLGDIKTASGTYEDTTGALTLDLGFAAGTSTTVTDTFTLTGNLSFTGGVLDGASQLAITGLGLLPAVNGNPAGSGDFGFEGPLACCSGSGTNGPNSFTAEPGGLQYMTLWGANFINADGSHTFDGNYTGATVGMDLRITLSPSSVPLSAVPVPAAVWLFGTALVGLVGFSKRRKVV